jgi:hypothetical protein
MNLIKLKTKRKLGRFVNKIGEFQTNFFFLSLFIY